MKKFSVVIRATVTKTYTVEAEDTDQAIETGHEIFSLEIDDAPEHYEQDTIDVWEVKQ